MGCATIHAKHCDKWTGSTMHATAQAHMQHLLILAALLLMAVNDLSQQGFMCFQLCLQKQSDQICCAWVMCAHASCHEHVILGGSDGQSCCCMLRHINRQEHCNASQDKVITKGMQFTNMLSTMCATCCCLDCHQPYNSDKACKLQHRALNALPDTGHPSQPVCAQ